MGGALPVGGDSGLLDIRTRALANGARQESGHKGTIREEDVWPGFVEQWGGFAPLETRPWVERLIPHLTESLTERLLPPTVIHSDFRVDNLFFDGDDVIALD